MRHICILVLIGSLLMAGCAKNSAVDVQLATSDHTNATATTEASSSWTSRPAADDRAAASAESMQKILFDFDSHLLTRASKDVLQKNARGLQDQPEVHIIIEGHTDERGASTYNLALGEKRAQAARLYLQNLGIAAERMQVISYGEEKPADHRQKEEAWAQNRRAEFVTGN